MKGGRRGLTRNSDASSYRVFAKNVSLIGIANGLMGIRGLFFIPIILKQLGEGDYGIWVQVIVFVVLASSVATLGLRNSIVRFLSSKESSGALRDGFYSSLTIAILVSSLAALLTGGVLRSFLDIEGGYAPVVSLGLWLIPIEAVSILNFAYFVGRRKMRTYAISTIMRGYGEVAAVYAFVGLGYGLLGALQATLLIRLAAALALLVLIVAELGVSLPRFQRFREYLNYGAPTMATMLSGWLLGFSDRYVIQLFQDSAAVGIYSAAYSVGHSVSFLLPTLTTTLNPTIFSLWEQGRKERARGFMTRALKFYLLLAVPGVFGVSFLAGPVLRLLGTPETAETGRMLVPLVALAMLVYGASVIFGRVFPLNKDTRTSGMIWTGAAIANVVLNLLFVPLLGLVGAAFATLISYVIALLLILLIGRKYSNCGPRLELAFLAKSIAASAVMLGAIYLALSALSPSLLVLGGIVLAGALIYFAVIRLLGALGTEEIEFLKGFATGRMKDE